MVEIFSLNLKNCMKHSKIETFKKLVSRERIEKANKFMFEIDQYRCFLGEMLARFAICQRTACKNHEIVFSRNDYGKPLLQNPNNLFFNVSHSGDWVINGISAKNIGVDVEILDKTKILECKNIFSEEENKILIKKNNDLEEWFYKIWTLKESYVKAEGEGLLIDFKTFNVCFEAENIYVKQAGQKANYYFKVFNLDEKHMAAICAQEELTNLKIKTIELTEMLEILDQQK